MITRTVKIEKTIAELANLNNQIRLELNQIRHPSQVALTPPRSHTSKKLFLTTHTPTNIIKPTNSTPSKPEGKKQLPSPISYSFSRTP